MDTKWLQFWFPKSADFFLRHRVLSHLFFQWEIQIYESEKLHIFGGKLKFKMQMQIQCANANMNTGSLLVLLSIP